MTTKVTGSILANTAVTAGSYGGSDVFPVITVDAQGRLISASNTSLPSTGVSATTYGGGVSSANFQLPIITVDTKGRITAASNVTVTSTAIYANTGQLVANTATGVVQIGLATSGANPGNYGSGTTTPVITVDSLGRITSVSSVLITGGSAGTVLYQSAANTTSNTIVGTSGYLLTSAGTGQPTWTNPASLSFTTANSQFYSIGVGTAADSANTGTIRATGTITAGYSDDQLKTKLGNIDNALDKLMTLNGFYYEPSQIALDLGYTLSKQVGVSAQEVQKVLPEVVVPAPIDDKYLTVQYDRMIPLLIEAIKELKEEVEVLKGQIK